MKSNWLFYSGVAIDTFTVLLTVSNLMLSQPFLQGEHAPPADGTTAIVRWVSWLAPLFFVAVIAGGFWLRSNGKLLAANILVCLPALPMLVGIIICGGLAVLFILLGK